MKLLAVLGREPKLSLAELEALFGSVRQIAPSLAEFELNNEFLGGWRCGRGDGKLSVSDVAEGGPPKLLQSKILGEELAAGLAKELAGLINRLGGTLKLARKLDKKPLDALAECPEGKITLGVSDYSKKASRKSANLEALKLKKILMRHGRSVRVVENKEATLSTATSLHNGLAGKNPRKIELIKVNEAWYKVIGVQDIEAYARRDQARPARDAKVGMLPPKLAQILINLCGILPPGACILDPFCGTGVVLQEALLMGYSAYGTDLEPRMVEYTKQNLEWLSKMSDNCLSKYASQRDLERVAGSSYRHLGLSATTGAELASCPVTTGVAKRVPNDDKSSWLITEGDATSYNWQLPIDAVVCEGYLGRPMSKIPAEIVLKTEKQAVQAILSQFLRNLAPQIRKNTPIVVAAPAWLREDGSYSRLNLIDFLDEMGYNVDRKTREGLFYHREGQIVARDIMILRKK